MAKFGEKTWFHKIGEEGINSSRRRRIQGIFVGHHDRTRAIPYIAKSGIVRGRGRTRQTLSDVRESKNLKNWFADPGHMVMRSHVMITETKLAVDDRPRIVTEKTPEIERRRFHVLSADIVAHGHTGGCPGCAALASQGKVTKFRGRVGMTTERTMTGKARMNAYKDRIAATERVREKKRARVERG